MVSSLDNGTWAPEAAPAIAALSAELHGAVADLNAGLSSFGADARKAQLGSGLRKVTGAPVGAVRAALGLAGGDRTGGPAKVWSAVYLP
ncbi:hypothetical protein [Kitasatospora sp. McL0602]|uniref:hypothetical protein n=1 Tax=Kitasatospora sp. McL0602 TaxID=3439530 RepID=UPI003F8C10EF